MDIRDSSGTASKFTVHQVVEDNKYLLGLAQCQMLCLALWKRRWMRQCLPGRLVATTWVISKQCSKWCDGLCTRCQVQREKSKELLERQCLNCVWILSCSYPKNGREREWEELSHQLLIIFQFQFKIIKKSWSTQGKKREELNLRKVKNTSCPLLMSCANDWHESR